MKVLAYLCAECEAHYWVEEDKITAKDKSTWCPECEVGNTPSESGLIILTETTNGQH